MKAEEVKTYDDLKLIIDEFNQTSDKEEQKRLVKEFAIAVLTINQHRKNWPILKSLVGKVVPVLEVYGFKIDVDGESCYYLGQEDYTIIDFNHYLNEIENDEK